MRRHATGRTLPHRCYRAISLADAIRIPSISSCNVTIDRHDRNWFRRTPIVTRHNSCQRTLFNAGSRCCRLKPPLPSAVSRATVGLVSLRAYICHMQHGTLATNQVVMPSGSDDNRVHHSTSPVALQDPLTHSNTRLGAAGASRAAQRPYPGFVSSCTSKRPCSRKGRACDGPAKRNLAERGAAGFTIAKTAGEAAWRNNARQH